MQRDDMYRFERDRALTAFMYQRRRDRGNLQWDDNVNSIRGLEDAISAVSNADMSITPIKALLRKQHMQLVVAEYVRLKDDGREYDALALAEVSCRSSSEAKVAALSLARDDAIAAGYSRTTLLKKVRSKLSIWLESGSNSGSTRTLNNSNGSSK